MMCPVCNQPVDDRVDPVAFAAALRVSPQQRRILVCLLASFGRFVDRHALLDAMYRHRGDGGPTTAEKCLHVEVHYLRARLAGSPLMIESSGVGGAGADRRLTWRDE